MTGPVEVSISVAASCVADSFELLSLRPLPVLGGVSMVYRRRFLRPSAAVFSGWARWHQLVYPRSASSATGFNFRFLSFFLQRSLSRAEGRQTGGRSSMRAGSRPAVTSLHIPSRLPRKIGQFVQRLK